jgi:phospholipase C
MIMMNRLALLAILIAVIFSLISSSILASVKAVAVTAASATPSASTMTPIKHLVVIFQENISFDHYFGTYPTATNPAGEPKFTADPNTPSINGLTESLLNKNPNVANPFRLDRSMAVTCDMNHDYMFEQSAYNGGLLDKFVEFTGSKDPGCDPKQVMGYYDGNTVTALWNYAQRFAMSDNFHGSTFGPSTPGALNLISGQTHGVTPSDIPKEVVNGTVIGDPDPTYDDCSKDKTVAMTSAGVQAQNVGDLLNAKNITWGWFQGGFKPSNYTKTAASPTVATTNSTSSASAIGKAVCASAHKNIAGKKVTDYSPHHEPFQYYKSTSNSHHLPPTSITMIGKKADQANHQYDLSDFWNAADAGNLPSVSFLKAAKYQDGHPGIAYSNPIDEQDFLVNTINHLQKLPYWNDTAVIIAYDDSDGWYDHVMPPIVSQSNDLKHDRLVGSNGLCGHAPTGAYQDRCGYGPRLPMLVISPYAKVNFIDHHITDTASILRFIEDNWGLGRIGNQSFDSKAGSLMSMFDFSNGASAHHAKKLFLNSTTGMQNYTGE